MLIRKNSGNGHLKKYNVGSETKDLDKPLRDTSQDF